MSIRKVPTCINLSVSRSCFVQCLGCYNYFGKSKIILRTQTIIDFLTYANEVVGIKKVTICGGDPLSRLNIIDLLKKIRKMPYYINLDTVGTPFLGDVRTTFHDRIDVPFIEPKTITSLVDVIGIPIDGPTNQIITSFRSNRPNILNEQLTILKKLNEIDAKVCINTVVHKKNIESIIGIFKLIKDYKCIIKWQLFQYMPIGPLGYQNKENYEIDDNIFYEFKDSLLNEVQCCDFLVEFKSRESRKGIYLLVDSDGIAWIPKIIINSSWDQERDANNERYILGDINLKNKYDGIFEKYAEYLTMNEMLLN